LCYIAKVFGSPNKTPSYDFKNGLNDLSSNENHVLTSSDNWFNDCDEVTDYEIFIIAAAAVAAVIVIVIFIAIRKRKEGRK
jgi:hypothetical protein